MPNNYITYAYLPDDITEIISNSMKYLHEKYKDLYKWQTTEIPHITIAYGPVLIDGEKEIDNYEPNDIEKLLPNFLNLKDEIGHPIINFKGVSYFNNANFWVIKVEFQSDGLNKLRTNLRDNNTVLDQRAKEFEDRDSYEYRSSIYPWAHSTLIVIKKDIHEEIVKEIIKDVENYLKLPESFEAKNISLISAITHTPIVLW
jgi:2'-5' RNA ligase